MDRRLYTIVLFGNREGLEKFVQENEATALERVTVADNNTVLHLAARAGKVELVKYLLEIRPDLSNILNKKGNTALHECAETGRNAQVARVLVNHRPDLLYQRNNFGEMALFTASEAGHITLVEEMLQATADPSMIECQRSLDGRTCLHAALIGRHLDLADVLLDRRSDVAIKSDNRGTTALHLAASGGHLRIAKRLTEVEPVLCYGVDDNQKSALHMAAAEGMLEIADQILFQKPDCIEMVDKDDRTALHLAVQNRQREMVDYLVERAAGIPEFVNKRDKDGNTALHLAMTKQSPQMIKKLLCAADINVNAMNNKGLTPLDIAAETIDYMCYNERTMLEELVKVTIAKNGGSSWKTGKDAHNDQMRKLAKEVKRGLMHNFAERHKEVVQKMGETVIIVAILIATVDFSAAFNVPGGLKSDGTPVLIHARPFQVFVIFDALALFTAIFGILSWISFYPTQAHPSLNVVIGAGGAVWMASICMTVAFTAAMYALLAPKSKWLAATFCSIAGVFVVFIIVDHISARQERERLRTNIIAKLVL